MLRFAYGHKTCSRKCLPRPDVAQYDVYSWCNTMYTIIGRTGWVSSSGQWYIIKWTMVQAPRRYYLRWWGSLYEKIFQVDDGVKWMMVQVWRVWMRMYWFGWRDSLRMLSIVLVTGDVVYCCDCGGRMLTVPITKSEWTRMSWRNDGTDKYCASYECSFASHVTRCCFVRFCSYRKW